MWFKPAEYQKPNQSDIATIATTATKSPDNVSLSQKSLMSQPAKVPSNNFNQPGNVAIVANVATGLSAVDRQTLLYYMAVIGEDDQEMIDELLNECSSKPDILKAQLQQARDCLQIRTGDTTGMVQCSGCNHLSGNTCNRHGWRVVVDKWRRCAEHATAQAIITCKSCGHFQGFNDRGGGAGACAAGVQPFGACWGG